METLDSSFEDNVLLFKRIVQNRLGGPNAASSSKRGGDTEVRLDSDDLFFNDLEEIWVLSPIQASLLRMVLLENLSELARTQ